MDAPVLEELLTGPLNVTHEAPLSAKSRRTIDGVVMGEFIGMAGEGRTPLVVYPGQPGRAAIVAQTTVDVHGTHIGRQVVLLFENGDPCRPIIMGWLHKPEGSPFPEQPGHVEINADGERLIVSAREQVVIRCGKASITLTKAGKVLIEGAYVLSRSSGVNRIKGGSIQLN